MLDNSRWNRKYALEKIPHKLYLCDTRTKRKSVKEMTRNKKERKKAEFLYMFT